MLPLIFIIVFVLLSAAEIWAAIRLAKQNNKQSFQAALVTFLFIFLYTLAELIFNIGVPRLIVMAVMISAFVQIFFGYYKNYFMRSKTFDRYLHAFGTFSYALFLFTLLNIIFKPALFPKFFASIFVFALGITVGALFEIFEFVSDQIKHTKMQKGLKDTNFDMIFNIAGSLIAAVVSYFLI